MTNNEGFIVFATPEEIQEQNNQNIDSDVNFDKSNFIEWNVKNILENDSLEKERIICIGKVQSGKTRNIIELINTSYHKYNYDLVFFICGTNNMLKNQSEERLHEGLNSFKALSNNFTENIGTFINDDKKNVLSVMKETASLNKLYNAIKHVDLSNKKIMIIDDECDYASVNTKANSNPSKIHEIIENLFKRIPKGKLISFTATPFANIINPKNIKNEEDNKTKIVVLENSPEYCGLEEFNKNSDKNYLTLRDNENEKNRPFIELTIFVYLITIIKKSIETNKEINSFKTECLINIDSDTINHEEIWDEVYDVLSCMEKEKTKLFKFFYKKINKELNIELFRDIDSDDFHNIYEPKIIELCKLIKKNGIILLNSKHKNNQINSNDGIKHQIKIGGVMLSRGVTYENLITELLLNYPKNMIAIDTLLQRCRWFGYRKNNMKFIHIIMTERLKKVFNLSQKYIDIFKPGIMDFQSLKNKLENLDSYYKKENIRSTSYDKWKK